MTPGRILVADHDGAYCMKLVGDVRMTLCTTIDLYVEAMLRAPDFRSVIIDLRGAEGLDSTTLGLLAKVAIGCRERQGVAPTVVSTHPSIARILQSVGFDRVFDMRESLPGRDEEMAELPMVAASEDAVRDRVIAAHRLLIDIDEDNRAAFEDLIVALERV
jgi:anti-anti-sigma factor